ncbi:hypothetical protein BV22DRAFT_1026280 [Leucogyrophana mollusca]|uniref:Uncharacterized protein n=1 Tax=Leucogyrophana mollusca TaxID=85980 RepID=A0ACB8AY28_9AGAM|nr:hypothetical protein BV22DRAFT_1026280 [Leucogyrophana mollusca]
MDGADFSSDEEQDVIRRLGHNVGGEEERDLNGDEQDEPEGNEDEQDEPGPDLFTSLGALFDFSDVAEDMEAVAAHEELPSAFDDHPSIRNAYIRAFVLAAFHGATHDAIQIMLEGQRISLIALCEDDDTLVIPGLENFACTLPTVLKRLGLSTEGFIVYFFICDTCWRLHHPATLLDLDSPSCEAEGCNGLLYTQKTLAGGTVKRTPTKIVPYVPPERALQRFLLRPGKWEQLQHWRGPGDAPGRVPPLTATGFDAFPDPSKPMDDIYDGWGWRAIQAGLERRRGGRWEIEDVSIREAHQRFVSLPCGLVWQINIDWFQAIKGDGSHSTGAFYAVICNNPRTIRYLAEETILIMVIPGPHEPSLEQMNHLLNPFVESILRLSKGVEFNVHGHDQRELSHSVVDTNVSDLPSSRKVGGLSGHTSKFFMCPTCKQPLFSLCHEDCFDHTKFTMRDDWRYIKYSFRARDATPDIAEAIAENRGARWSVLNALPGWMPGANGVVEFMHCVFLTLVKHLNKVILLKNGLLNGGRRIQPSARLQDFFSTLIWPVEVTRLPNTIMSGKGSPKADQWRSQLNILFVALFVAWETNGEIPDADAPPSPPHTNHAAAQASLEKMLRSRLLELAVSKNPDVSEAERNRINSATMDRNLRRHYQTIVEFSAAIRILSTQSISPNDVKRGCAALSRAVRAWARMGCHLTPYFHFAQHLEAQFYKYGTCYAIWAWGFERHNGTLGRVNHNQHKGGELEGTMMRRWWSSTFNYDLILQLEALPNRGAADENAIELLKSCLKTQQKDRMGTVYRNVLFSKYPRDVNIHQLSDDVYDATFAYLRMLWHDRVDLRRNNDISGQGSNFMGLATSHTHVWYQSKRYGASTTHRGRSARFAYIHGRVAAEIQYILRVTHKEPGLLELTTDIAIVRRFHQDDALPHFPWEIWATDLGVSAWYANDLGEVEAVPISALSGHFVLAPITVNGQDIWITVAFDHVGPSIAYTTYNKADSCYICATEQSRGGCQCQR